MKKSFKRTTVPILLLLLFLPGNAFTADIEGAGLFVPPVRQELLLSFTGDMMAHVINYVMDDYSLIYSDIEDIMLNDSLTFSNVEFPVNPALPQASFPVFNIHPEYVQAAVNAGVDVLSLANNHTADQGTGGLKATVQAVQDMANHTLETLGRRLYFSGAKEEPETEFFPVTIYKEGWKIGYIAVSQFSNVEPEPGYMKLVDFRNPAESEEFINWIAEESRHYDLFILGYHGGVEYLAEPVPQKAELFRKFVSAGADIVWGHHPHIIQPIEVISSESGNSGVIMHSLGNFISGQGRIIDPDLPEEEWSYTGDSAIIQVRLTHDGKKPVIEDVSAVPIANMMTTNREVVISPLEKLTHQPVPAPWMNFFLERFILMHDYFNRNIQYSFLP